MKNMTSKKLPAISWPQFLLSAPYFTSALSDSVSGSFSDLPALPRAVLYWDLFDAEISNGGVAQYFYNQALSLPGFDQVPEFVAAHPVLNQYRHFVDEVHKAWYDVSEQVHAAEDEGDWPEELFKSLKPKFEALETAFFAINHDISQVLNAYLLGDPHAYFDIAPLDDVTANGLAWIECRGKGFRGKLRFVDGFPVGPNVFERGNNGGCDVVWFSRDRQIMVCERVGEGGKARNRDTIHYPSFRTHQMRFNGVGLESQSDGRSFWYKEGLHESYHDNGCIKSSKLYAAGNELVMEYFHKSGQLMMRTEQHEGQQCCVRYWPNGQINTRSTKEDAHEERYQQCFAEDGTDLAPNGNGTLRQTISDGGWCEGRLVDGLLEGEVTCHKKDGSLDGKAFFKRGRDN